MKEINKYNPMELIKLIEQYGEVPQNIYSEEEIQKAKEYFLLMLHESINRKGE